jgi:hypothetical protein
VHAEIKERQNQWMQTHSRNKQKRCKQTSFAFQEADGNVFWDRKRVLIVELMEQGTAVTSEV